MRIAPLLPVATGLIVGVTLDHRWPLDRSWGWGYVAVLAALTMISISRRNRSRFGVLLVFAASVCTGAAWHLSVERTVPASSIEHYTDTTDRIARLRGQVVSAPRVLPPPPNPFGVWTYGSERTVFLLRVESIEGVNGDFVRVSGFVRATVDEAILDLKESERVEVFGRLYRFKPPRNPGSFDWASYYRHRGIAAGFLCRHRENVKRLGGGMTTSGTGLAAWFRAVGARCGETARGMLTDDLAAGADEQASLLEAMVLGHRSRLDRRINDLFIRAGCVHFLAVSGVHVGIVMFFAYLACRVLMLRPRTSTWVMMLTVILYALVAEPRPPILRATIMALLYCVARLIRRPRAGLNWLSAAAVILILVDPGTVYQVGFQLSFAAVLGVMYVAPALRQACLWLRRVFETVVLKRPFLEMDRRLTDAAAPTSSGWAYFALRVRRMLWRVRRVVWRLTFFPFSVGIAAWLICWPIVAIHFHRVHPWGPINSVIILPLVSLVMLLGFVKMILTVVHPLLGVLLGGGLVFLDGFLIEVVELLGSLPGASMFASTPTWWVVMSYYCFLMLLAWRFRPSIEFNGVEGALPAMGAKSPPPVWLKRSCRATFAVFMVGVAIWQWPVRSDRLVITFLSVGRASAVVLELPDGGAVLCDAGSMDPYDVGRGTVVPFLRHRGITRIDRVYISHPNLDHFSGLLSVIDEVPTGPVFVNRCFDSRSPPRSPARHLLEELAKRNHPIERLGGPVRRWEMAGVLFEYFSPPDDLSDAVSTNDTSTVMRLSYAGHSILLTGDIEERTQRALIEWGGVKADVLVLPHHGAVRAATRSFIHSVSPRILIRSSGERMTETQGDLQDIIGGIPLYNTGDLGAIEVVIDRAGVRVSPRADAPPPP